MNGEDHNQEKKRRRKPVTWCQRLLFIIGGILIGLICAELAARLGGVYHTVILKTDPVFGRRFIPGVEGWQLNEGRAYVRINSQGWRDRERSKSKGLGTRRIVVLGDSFTSARQVDIDETFCAVMEQELALGTPDGTAKTEVLNFGVCGYGTAQEFLVLENCVWEYAPDIVLLAFFPGNDVLDNSLRLTKEMGDGHGGDYGCRPFFVKDDFGKLRLDNSFRDSPWFRENSSWGARAFTKATQYSRLAGLLNTLRSRKFRMRKYANQDGLNRMVYVNQQDEAWDITETIILKMRNACAARNVRFAIVTVSMPVQVHPDHAMRAALKKDLGVDTLFAADQRIADFGLESGIPVLNLALQMQKYAETEQTFLHGFEDTPGVGHWNVKGHLFAGRTIAAWLLEWGNLPGPSDQTIPEMKRKREDTAHLKR